jgi:hypothetical protein
MKTKKRENKGFDININLDSKNYKLFVLYLKKLGKEYESKSNENKLNYSIYSSCRRNPYVKVKGICSRVTDPKGKISEVFFADYDNCLLRIVESECNYLMEEYGLSACYVFTTGEQRDDNRERYGNYHVISITKNNFRDVVKMQNELHCDEAYKKIALLYRFSTWVLRLGPKKNRNPPKFVKIIGDLNKKYSQNCSNAHLKLIESLYPDVPKLNYLNLDKGELKDLVFSEYTTSSNVNKKIGNS